jgi:hypothetical protein
VSHLGHLRRSTHPLTSMSGAGTFLPTPVERAQPSRPRPTLAAFEGLFVAISLSAIIWTAIALTLRMFR